MILFSFLLLLAVTGVINARATTPAPTDMTCQTNCMQHQCSDMMICAIDPTNCYEILERGCSTSGVYRVFPGGSNVSHEVYCDQETDGGGWQVIQRRQDGSVDFYRTWEDYKNGFGSASGETWFGNENIYQTVKEKLFEVRIEMVDFQNATKYAAYKLFSVGDLASEYALKIEGYSGDAGDSMSYHNGSAFFTRDRDTDRTHCAQNFKGGWWYNACDKANLNGLYLHGYTNGVYNGISWKMWEGPSYSLKETEIKIRPW